jgi:hypothetical protein
MVQGGDARSFPPGSHLLILNYSNQVVLTLTIDNDGGVSGTLPATLDDAMMVTLTDPDARTLTKNVSRYVDAATGRTAVGTFGARWRPAGLQLSLPGRGAEGHRVQAGGGGAVSIPADKRPTCPAPRSHPRCASFREAGVPQEWTCLPAGRCTRGAFFYVYRQLQGPDGKIVYQTIDKAVVEGDRVITASIPTWTRPQPRHLLSDAGGQVAVSAVAHTVSVLMWTYNQLVPGKVSAAAFRQGAARRWNQQTHSYDYIGVPNAIVRRVQLPPQEHDPLVAGNGTMAFSRSDGKYTFTDSTFTAGVATVRATDPATGQTLDATAFAVVPPPEWAAEFQALATANITFPALEQPPPAPQALIKVLVRENGVWRFAQDNVVVTGVEVAIGIAPANATVQRAKWTASRSPCSRADPTTRACRRWPCTCRSVGRPHHRRHAGTAHGTAGRAVGRVPGGGRGGGNNVPLPGPPRVLRTAPHDGAKDTSPELLPEVVFTEPVSNVLAGDNVRLIETATESSRWPSSSVA